MQCVFSLPSFVNVVKSIHIAEDAVIFIAE